MDDKVLELLRKIDNGYEPNAKELNWLSSVESISWRGIDIIPRSISLLTDLTYLDLSKGVLDESELKTLPDEITELQSLQNLILRQTALINLPENIGRMTNLKSLDLTASRITLLPESIGKLVNLQYLYLSATPLLRLPEGIGALNSLHKLDLSRTLICELPESISKLSNLSYLNLSDTGLSELAECMGKLRSLRCLVMRYARIKKMSETIGKLKNLQVFDLSSARIGKLAKSIGKLPKLKQLVLEHAIIDKLPENLLNLNLAYIEDNYSYEYGEQPDNYPGIFIHDLELKKQPIEIFFQSRELIYEYYKSQKNMPTKPINECKVVFLGDGGAGKSLIIDRLMHNGKRSLAFTGESTPGINISSKKYHNKKIEVELHFWDFGGQPIMHTMHRMFLTNRTLYVIVVNARDNKADEQSWYWIRNIMSFATGAPVFLLINQKDQNPYVNINYNGLKKEYSGLVEMRIVSALKDSQQEFNVNIRDVILQMVSGMETVHTLFPESWLSLMNDLRMMKEDYITSDVFYNKCRDNGIETETEVLDQIISWYQDLGVCFYSRSNPAAREYMVLKPIWLLNALYLLIFNGRKYAKNGIIQEKDIYRLICEPLSVEGLKMVWTDIQYGNNEIQYIINVLLNYYLIYRLDNERIFIPMLCDENEPEIKEFIESENTIHVSFEYAYLPENVLHRLMVHYCVMLRIDKVWRTGAVFEQKRCGWHSIVRIKNNCLDVYAKADEQSIHPVNSYLDMIRDSIYKINADLGLKAEEFIAFRNNGSEDQFNYDTLLGYRKSNLPYVYSKVFDTKLLVDEILGIIGKNEDDRLKGVIEQMNSALRSMSERCVDMQNRNEVELTRDFQNIIEAVLNAKFGIQVAREYTLGRANVTIGETDLLFFENMEGKKQELYILENKSIENFTKQYYQLMGYLNPNFTAGITLSINKRKSWEDGVEYIYERLNDIRSEGGSYAPILIKKETDASGTRYVKTEHIVPETGRTMAVYHLVMQLYDKEREMIAIKARK